MKIIKIQSCDDCPFMIKDSDGHRICNNSDLLLYIPDDVVFDDEIPDGMDEPPSWCPLDEVQE